MTGGRRRSGRRRPWRFWIAVTVLTLVVATLGGVVVTRYGELRRLQESDAAGREAVVAARPMVVDLLSYSHETVEQDLARARTHTTGELAGHYRTLAARLVGDAKRQRIVRQASVVAAGVETAEPDRVRVVVFVDMITTRQPEGEAEPLRQRTPSRVRLLMVKRDSRWLVEELSTLLGGVSVP